MKLSLSFN